MEKLAVTKNVRITARKARQVAKLVQGKPAVEALNMLALMPRKAAQIIALTLKSAVANAENDEKGGVDRKLLTVKECVIGEGPTLKRFQPKARGSAGRVLKRTSHVRVIVSDEK